MRAAMENKTIEVGRFVSIDRSPLTGFVLLRNASEYKNPDRWWRWSRANSNLLKNEPLIVLDLEPF
jgi:hypothetical protein